MKTTQTLMIFLLSLVLSQLSLAEESPNAISKAKETTNLAKIAKAKAQLRQQQAQISEGDLSPLSTFDTEGCDINIGNVALDGLSDSPEEITILIDGDIIQSNNCR